jgi:hypothetical protein
MFHNHSECRFLADQHEAATRTSGDHPDGEVSISVAQRNCAADAAMETLLREYFGRCDLR